MFVSIGSRACANASIRHPEDAIDDDAASAAS